MATNITSDPVVQYYGRPEITNTIFNALKSAGKDINKLKVDDLEPIDQLHVRGKDATRDLARMVNIRKGTNVLDVGGGIGGPARLLASEYNCHVTVLDLVPEFCETGKSLTSRIGLSDRVSFHQGSALSMPFGNESFDVVWTQHSSMNIRDKEQMFREIYRVLKPGGKLALHDILAGPEEPVHFPVFWARNPEISYLTRPEPLRDMLTRIGFKETKWIDTTNKARSWIEERIKMIGSSKNPLTMDILLGNEYPDMFKNMLRNINERRTVVVQGVFERQKTDSSKTRHTS